MQKTGYKTLDLEISKLKVMQEGIKDELSDFQLENLGDMENQGEGNVCSCNDDNFEVFLGYPG